MEERKKEEKKEEKKEREKEREEKTGKDKNTYHFFSPSREFCAVTKNYQ